ncbi:hypothetical protein B0181_03745 [Moraxella caviae]|uniref:Uncharacterized protein n=1 Tax=Moraxella caviae TaxID=34060 RepID=A0A1T0A5U2_9GAMM|nr:hypothetical protein B0181_03745 [Moraxella caviae]
MFITNKIFDKIFVRLELVKGLRLSLQVGLNEAKFNVLDCVCLIKCWIAPSPIQLVHLKPKQ